MADNISNPANGSFPDSPFTPTGTAPSAPPPPSEVKVRTMRSDLQSMAKSGGGLPRFESVRMDNLSLGKAPSTAGPSAPAKSKGAIMAFLIVLAILAIVGAGIFFVYRVYLGGSLGSLWPSLGGQAPAKNAPVPAAAGGQNGASLAPLPAAPTSTPPFTHTSLFKRAADQTLTLTLGAHGSASSATDLQTFNQKLMAVLTQTKKTSTMIEVAMQGTDGKGIAVGDLFAQANVPLIDPAFLAAHFAPDETFFAYRDKNGGLWPGLILSLKAGENWLFVKDGVTKLESATAAIQNLFLTDVGAPSPDGFTDSSVSSTPVRVLPFAAADTAAYFTYGWNRTYLIVSTSQKGFADAAARL